MQLTDATHTHATQRDTFLNATHWYATFGTRITRQVENARRDESIQLILVDKLKVRTHRETQLNPVLHRTPHFNHLFALRSNETQYTPLFVSRIWHTFCQ